MSELESEFDYTGFTKELTISIVGKSSVGKSSWINTVINKEWTMSERTTRGKNHKTFRLNIEKEEYIIHARDFGGQPEYLNLVKTNGADGVDIIFLAFDLNEDDTFFELFDYVPDGISEVNIPLYLIGLKNDLDKKVTDEDIASFMMTYGIPSGFKISSKEMQNILEPFKKAISDHFDVRDIIIDEIEFNDQNSREKRVACRAIGCGKVHTIILSDSDIDQAKRFDNSKNEFFKKIIVCHGKSKQFNDRDHQLIIKIDNKLDERPVIVEELPQESLSSVGLEEQIPPLPTKIDFNSDFSDYEIPKLPQKPPTRPSYQISSKKETESIPSITTKNESHDKSDILPVVVPSSNTYINDTSNMSYLWGSSSSITNLESKIDVKSKIILNDLFLLGSSHEVRAMMENIIKQIRNIDISIYKVITNPDTQNLLNENIIQRIGKIVLYLLQDKIKSRLQNSETLKIVDNAHIGQSDLEFVLVTQLLETRNVNVTKLIKKVYYEN